MLWWFVLVLLTAAAGASVIATPWVAIAAAAALLLTWAVWNPGRALYVLFALLMFVPTTIDVGVSGLTLTYVWAAAAAICLLGRAQRWLQGHPVTSPGLWATLLFAPLTLSALAHWPGVMTTQENMRPLLVLILVIWHATAEARLDPDRIRRVALLLLACSVPVLAVAIYQRITGTWPVLDQLATDLSHTSASGPTRSAGTMGHPIIYGTFCLAMVIVAMWSRPRFWAALALGNVLGLILSGARSAWIAAAVAAAVWLVHHRGHWITPGRILAGFFLGTTTVSAALAFPAAFTNTTSALFDRFNGVDSARSAAARATRFDVAVDRITHDASHFALGHGPGGFIDYVNRYGVGDDLARTLDNSYLLLWFDYGLIAVFAAAALLVVALRRPGAEVGKLILLGFTVQILLFDFYAWPTAVGVLALALALREIPASTQERVARRNVSAEVRGGLLDGMPVAMAPGAAASSTAMVNP